MVAHYLTPSPVSPPPTPPPLPFLPPLFTSNTHRGSADFFFFFFYVIFVVVLFFFKPYFVWAEKGGLGWSHSGGKREEGWRGEGGGGKRAPPLSLLSRHFSLQRPSAAIGFIGKERVLQQLGGSRAEARRPLEAQAEEVEQAGILDVVRDLRRGRRVCNVVEDLPGGVGVHGVPRRAAQHLQHRAPEGPDVTLGAIRPRLRCDHLGRHPERRADHGGGADPVVVAAASFVDREHLRAAEVGELDVAFLCDEQVRTLHVSVHHGNGEGVEVVQAVEHLTHVRLDDGGTKPLGLHLLHQVGDRAARAQLQVDVQLLVCVHDAVPQAAHDVRVAQLLHHGELGVEGFEHVVVRARVQVHDLHRDLLRVLQLPQVHRAEAPLAQRLPHAHPPVQHRLVLLLRVSARRRRRTQVRRDVRARPGASRRVRHGAAHLRTLRVAAVHRRVVVQRVRPGHAAARDVLEVEVSAAAVPGAAAARAGGSACAAGHATARVRGRGEALQVEVRDDGACAGERRLREAGGRRRRRPAVAAGRQHDAVGDAVAVAGGGAEEDGLCAGGAVHVDLDVHVLRAEEVAEVVVAVQPRVRQHVPDEGAEQYRTLPAHRRKSLTDFPLCIVRSAGARGATPRRHALVVRPAPLTARRRLRRARRRQRRRRRREAHRGRRRRSRHVGEEEGRRPRVRGHLRQGVPHGVHAPQLPEAVAELRVAPRHPPQGGCRRPAAVVVRGGVLVVHRELVRQVQRRVRRRGRLVRDLHRQRRAAAAVPLQDGLRGERAGGERGVEDRRVVRKSGRRLGARRVTVVAALLEDKVMSSGGSASASPASAAASSPRRRRGKLREGEVRGGGEGEAFAAVAFGGGVVAVAVAGALDAAAALDVEHEVRRPLRGGPGCRQRAPRAVAGHGRARRRSGRLHAARAQLPAPLHRQRARRQVRLRLARRQRDRRQLARHRAPARQHAGDGRTSLSAAAADAAARGRVAGGLALEAADAACPGERGEDAGALPAVGSVGRLGVPCRWLGASATGCAAAACRTAATLAHGCVVVCCVCCVVWCPRTTPSMKYRYCS
eukprot:Rhum_TRINITY_DN14635_c9_g1::Rhum_TRINITY_DN14635_c9_g1_i1::g.105765::m.105765